VPVPGNHPPGINEPARFRLVHHAEVISLKGDSYRLKNRDLGRIPAATTTDDT
jgi:DNA replication protein DnaC